MSDLNIVVPLDGSALAEKALPFAVALARLRGQKLLLLTVLSEGSYPERSGVMTQVVDEATTYLALIRKEISQEGLPNRLDYEGIETKVVSGRSPHNLGEIINTLEASEVVMTTHGRTGLSRFVLGSIARDTLEQVHVPVILLRPVELAESALPMELMYQKTSLPLPGEKASGQLVVALDGTAEAEVVVQPALELCKAAGFELCLVRVIPPYTPIADGVNYRAGDETAERQTAATKYLQDLRARLAEAEPDVSILIEVLSGHPAEAILEYTRRGHTTLVAMTSHSYGRMALLMTGSVAEKVLDESHLPVLMVHRK